MSKHVIVGNKFPRHYALKFNSNVTLVPTVVDTDRYRPKEDYRPKGKVTIGWVGLAYNLPYVRELAGVLRVMQKT